VQCTDSYALQKTHYAATRKRFGLNAQRTVRALAKVCDAYSRDLTIRPAFRPRGAVAYDQRLLSVPVLAPAQGGGEVSLATLEGRVRVPFVGRLEELQRLQGKRGQADLMVRKGKWLLAVTVEVPEAPQRVASEALGVDLGIVNLATDSDGEHFSGAPVDRVRERSQALRTALQAKGTKSAKRHLKKLSGREARFRRDKNHCISKRIVRKAQGTGRKIALEDLKGIRGRVTVRHPQRSRLGGWAFHQLRAFIQYKAALVGVEVVLVDPRNTSRSYPRLRPLREGQQALAG
jgi:IS605 OrfB family transposase